MKSANYGNTNNEIQTKFFKSTSNAEDFIGSAYDLNVGKFPMLL